MADEIPEDVIAFVRDIFAEANAEASVALARQPAIHEEQLDFQIFGTLDRVGPRITGSGAAVEIETHWLGGRRHFEHRWEIADIALIVILRRSGRLVWRKVALLQSKRLYSREIPVAELDRTDYAIGIGRLFDRTDSVRPLSTERKFSFTPDCVYAAMTARSRQVEHIDSYMRSKQLPVYYSFYNPPDIPYEGTVPSRSPIEIDSVNLRCGCRVLTALEAHDALSRLPGGKAPSFDEMIAESRKSADDSYAVNGWRLETFVADEVLRCRQGRRFEDKDDSDLRALLYERTAPIASGIAVTIDLPGEARPRRRPHRGINLD